MATFTVPPRGTRIGDSTVMDEEVNADYEPTEADIIGKCANIYKQPFCPIKISAIDYSASQNTRSFWAWTWKRIRSSCGWQKRASKHNCPIRGSLARRMTTKFTTSTSKQANPRKCACSVVCAAYACCLTPRCGALVDGNTPVTIYTRRSSQRKKRSWL